MELDPATTMKTVTHLLPQCEYWLVVGWTSGQSLVLSEECNVTTPNGQSEQFPPLPTSFSPFSYPLLPLFPLHPPSYFLLFRPLSSIPACRESLVSLLPPFSLLPSLPPFLYPYLSIPLYHSLLLSPLYGHHFLLSAVDINAQVQRLPNGSVVVRWSLPASLRERATLEIRIAGGEWEPISSGDMKLN